MREQELIKKIKKFRTIEPEKDWVLLAKRQILGDYKIKAPSFWAFQLSPAFVLPLLIVILIGGTVFINPQNRGLLYSYLDSVIERNGLVQEQEEDGAEFYLSLAEQKIKKLGEISKEKDQSEVLASAIQDTKEAVKKAAESIPKVRQSPTQTSKYVEKVTRIQAEKEEIERVLGINLGEEEFEQLEKEVLTCIINSIGYTESEMELLSESVKREIEYQETRTLTESEKQALGEAKELYEQGNYSQALEKLLGK